MRAHTRAHFALRMRHQYWCCFVYCVLEVSVHRSSVHARARARTARLGCAQRLRPRRAGAGPQAQLAAEIAAQPVLPLGPRP